MNKHAQNEFKKRHIGIQENDLNAILAAVDTNSIDQLIEETVPNSIRLKQPLNIAPGQTEYFYLSNLKKIASKNKVFKSYIGLGYNDVILPPVIQRNIFENPGWYTQYTPYQAEIAQGRLESLLNFQTMIVDLTGLPVANASLLDEGTAAAEAMNMFFHDKNKRATTAPKFFVSNKCFLQTIDIIQTRAQPLGIEVVLGDWKTAKLDETFFGALVQNPDIDGNIADFTSFINHCHEVHAAVCVSADIMSLVLVKSPGAMGADCVVGNSQRFGVPMGFGGPHAAFFSTTEDFKRTIPGRIIGVSQDRNGNRALRMALQTREQHIRREKATSNICTAQALLANIAAMYAVYHGSEGLKNIASTIHSKASILSKALQNLGYKQINTSFFDTLTFEADPTKIKSIATAKQCNFRYESNLVGISINECAFQSDIQEIVDIFAEAAGKNTIQLDFNHDENNISSDLKRNGAILDFPVFNSYHSETKMMRYIKSLEEKDLSLTKSMIALGSCTMKLNAAAELMPVTWPEFSKMHPFAPADQTEGYLQIIHELEKDLAIITGFDSTSLQPNSGAQGEYAGLIVIRAYQKDQGQEHRNIVLIPASAHGTNPASAVMAGLHVVVVACDSNGNIDMNDLKIKAEQHKDVLSCLMVTYPSTHGVFEETIKEVCQIIHTNGGQVYMDGANMNAQVGLTSPGEIGADVCHLNLHKTFAIPHGGGGPGMGPICVVKHLAPYLSGHKVVKIGSDKATSAVSAAPWGSASILLISYAYIKMLGGDGLTDSTKYAILNANYIKSRLGQYYDVLYTGSKNRVAHELILDFRPFKHTIGVEVEDVAKRLMDYGFHAPTVSFPVAGTLMIEPTESEDKDEIDRFCDALIEIKKEIEEIASGKFDKENNVLKNAPHTIQEAVSDNWEFPYSREKAVFPLPIVKDKKFWPTVARVNNSFGDRNLVCTCAPIEAYMEAN
ncbi:MAG: aminomethyl-transferring glycine dehydrogenase [Chitinophagales bacterium]|nr:aminomethyl-transferring glycine dehydrogenase [Chitinophagales bacterium]